MVQSRLGEKLAYIHRHWDGLQIFLTGGRVEMDTNPVENTIRPITLNRKNALFAGHDEGGHTWARMASLIETCKLNAGDPYAYLRETLTAIANRHPASRIDDLMPWAFQKQSSSSPGGGQTCPTRNVRSTAGQGARPTLGQHTGTLRHCKLLFARRLAEPQSVGHL